MRTFSKHLVIALGAIAAARGAASANGFLINEHDARVTGRGGAAAATDTDASAIVFNPGGLAAAPEGDNPVNVSLGLSVVQANASYTDLNDNTVDTNGNPQLVPQAMVSYRINRMFAAGVSLHAPFGLAVSWPDQNPQSDIVTDQSLRTYFVTPAIGVNLGDFVPGLSVGAGLDLVPATVDLQQNLFFGNVEGHAELGGKAFGVGGRVGVMYRPAAAPKLSVGVAYKSQVNLDFTGTGDFDMPQPFRSQLPPDGDIATTVKLPMSVTGAVAYRPLDQLELEVDGVWIDWSKFKDIDILLPDGSHNVQPQDYTDTFTIRVGAEYHLPDQHLALRAGYIYDPTPVPDTTISARLPDIDRNDVTVGATYSVTKQVDVHAALLWVIPGTANASNKMYMPIPKGSYDVDAFVGSLGLTGRL